MTWVLLLSLLLLHAVVGLRPLHSASLRRGLARLPAVSITQSSGDARAECPVLLYLPGLDANGSYSLNAFVNLTQYDVWRLAATPDDRTPFLDLSQTVCRFLEQEQFLGRNVTLVGESCGALFAAHVALRGCKQGKAVSRLVLVNPATSYDSTSWEVTGRIVAASGPAFPIVGLATLMATAIDPGQFFRVGNDIMSRVKDVESLQRELNGLLAAGNAVTQTLPPETLRFRLEEWLERGSRLVLPRLRDLTVPTLVLVGTSDRLLPSQAEGRRLGKLLPNVQVKEVEGAGHALLDGVAVDLAKELRLAKVFRPKYTGKRSPDTSSRDTTWAEFPVPSEEDMDEMDKTAGFGNLQKLFSPVFLSTEEDGRVVQGLGGVPTGLSGRPVLLVGNHQLFGADLGLLMSKFVREKKALPRGLGHPVIFQGGSPGLGMGAGAGAGGGGRANDPDKANRDSPFLQMGAVEVSPMALFDLLSRNETVLLFPGGVSEAFHHRDQSNEVLWPERTDFVRMAALHKAIIVPFGAIGMADSALMLLDGPEIAQLPLGLGQRAIEASRQAPQARAGGDESMIAPLVIPGPQGPQRTYFLFQKPLDTAELLPDSADKKAAKTLYQQARQQVIDAVSYLLEYRKEDPYASPIPRLVWERLNEGKQAPSR